MTFSKDLRFHQHINAICHKINKTLSPLYSIAKHIPRSILDQIYKVYIRPHFDYCDAIYDGHITIQDATRLETLQNRAARLVTGGLFRTPSDKLRAELGWDRLTTRRRIHRLTLYHKLNDPEQHCPNYIKAIMPNTRAQDTDRQLRNANMHTTTTSRTSSYHKSFFPTTCTQWNELPSTTQHLTHTTFKKQLSEHLGASDPPLYFSVGSKKGNILHARLRMDMTYLNSHLFSIQKTTSPSCQCGHRNETVNHFVISCQNHTEQRDILFKSISQTLLPDFINKSPKEQLRIILYGTDLTGCGGRSVALYFQNFLLNSKRFADLY